jgi:hypothetical protein
MAASKQKRPTKKTKSLPTRALTSRKAQDVKGGAYETYVKIHLARQGKDKGVTIK